MAIVTAKLFPAMSIEELESEVTRLSKPDLAAFTQSLEDFVADSWDKQIETDMAKGKLDQLGKQAEAQFEVGRCTPRAQVKIVTFLIFALFFACKCLAARQ